MPYRYHYDPNQPRVPSGEHDGGQWTSGGNAGPSILQQVRYSPRENPLQKGIEAALAFFAWLSRYNSDHARAILQFSARQYNREDTDAFSMENVRVLTREEVDRICKRLELVQMLTDNNARAERPFKNSMSRYRTSSSPK